MYSHTCVPMLFQRKVLCVLLFHLYPVPLRQGPSLNPELMCAGCANSQLSPAIPLPLNLRAVVLKVGVSSTQLWEVGARI